MSWHRSGAAGPGSCSISDKSPIFLAAICNASAVRFVAASFAPLANLLDQSPRLGNVSTAQACAEQNYVLQRKKKKKITSLKRDCNLASYYGSVKFEQRQTTPEHFRRLSSRTSFFLRHFFLLSGSARTSVTGCAVKLTPASCYTDLATDGMSRVKYSVLPYTRPVGASDEDATRARQLLTMRSSSYNRGERERRKAAGDSIETLQDLAFKYDKEQQRFAPPAKEKNLRNVEFLAAMILDGEGRSAAVPPIWRTPVDLPTGRKRRSVNVTLPAPSIDGSVQPVGETFSFDPLNVSR